MPEHRRYAKNMSVLNILPLLDLIQKRPGMYLGSKSLLSLRAFVDGYSHCSYEADHTLTLSDFDGFNDWAAKHFGYSYSQMGWKNMILAHCMGLAPDSFDSDENSWDGFDRVYDRSLDEIAFDTFFVLLQQYKTNKSTVENSTK